MSKIVLIGALALLAVGYSSCSNGEINEHPISEKEKVISLLKSIETRDEKPLSYINPEKYIQHNLNVVDGVSGFQAFLGTLPQGKTKVNVVRTFQEGNYVFSHVEYNLGSPIIGFDVFRFENGKIVEHWDNLQAKSGANNPSGHSMIDGVTKITDHNKTAENKALVQQFVKNVLVEQNYDKLASYYDESIIQHNPSIGDSITGLTSALGWMAENGITMVYDRIHKVLGEGNFVLVISEGSFAGKHTSFYDLFRVSNGKIIEHWDVLETIPPESEWKNKNGKFNF